MHPRSTPPRWKTRGGDPGCWLRCSSLKYCPIFSVVAPCHRGASPASVRRRDFHHGLLASLLCRIVCSALEPVIRIVTFVIAYRHSTEDRDEGDVGIGADDWCRCRPRLAAGAAAIVAG